MVRRIKPFPLTQHFIVTSFFTTLIVAAVTALLTGLLVENEVIDRSQDYAEKVIRHLQEDILENFIRPTLAEDGTIDLSNPRHYARLDAVVTRLIADFRVRALYIFDPNGTVIYATNPEHLNQRVPPSNDLFQQALLGKSVAAVRGRGDPLDLGRKGEVPLLETYVPVTSLADKGEVTDSSQIANVIETYLELDVVNEEIRQTKWRVSIFTMLGSAILFAVLLFIVRRADVLIQERSRDVLESNTRLHELTESLEAEVERRTDELVNKEKLASLGTLAAGIAHEVNNPLATIAGAAEGLQHRIADAREGMGIDYEDFDSYLDMIQLEAFRVKQLTQSLLNLSRQQADEIVQLLDAGRLIHEMHELVRVSGAMDGVEVEIDRKSFGLLVHVFETSIRQVIFNLMRNSVDAIHERQEANPDFEGGTIHWSVREIGTQIEFLCSDDGIGFAQGEGRKMMEPFFTTKPPGKGTGLGLALCHSLAEQMRGTIQITSPGKNQGAVVRLLLPKQNVQQEGIIR